MVGKKVGSLSMSDFYGFFIKTWHYIYDNYFSFNGAQ
jgi:hypothetical protein